MDWPRILAYITGTVDQELLLRNDDAQFNPTRQKIAGTLASPEAAGSYIYSLHTAPALR